GAVRVVVRERAGLEVLTEFDEGRHQRAVAPPARHLRHELLVGVLARQRGTVRSIGRDGVECIDDADNLREERHVRATQAVRVARAVQSLMMVADYRPHELERSERSTQPLTDDRMLPHETGFLWCERLRLEENGVGNAYLPDIVQERPATQREQLRVGQPD